MGRQSAAHSAARPGSAARRALTFMLGAAACTGVEVAATAIEAGRVAAYNRAVSEWMQSGGGLSQIENAFPGQEIQVQFSKPGPTVVKPTTLTLPANWTTYNLNYQDPGLKWYNGTLWFESVLPMWDSDWSNVTNVGFNSGRDQYFELIPFDMANGGQLMPMSLEAFTCSEYTQQIPCTDLAAPPPPGPWTHRNEFETLRTNTGRRLMQDDDNMTTTTTPSGKNHVCTGYFREMKFLNSVTLLTSLSGVNSSFTFSTGSCSLEYTTVTMSVPETIYAADMSTPDGNKQMMWCQSWPVHFPPPTGQPSFYIRSSTDPYVVAGEITDCTWDFSYAPPKKAMHTLSKDDILVPAAILVVSTVGLLLACFSTRRSPQIDYAPLLRDDTVAGTYGTL